MSVLDSYQLTHPELLSERQLCEVLKNSCIETSRFQRLCKAELVELYKKIALPLSQRRPAGNNNTKDNDTDHNSYTLEVDDWKSDKDDKQFTTTSTLSEQTKKMSHNKQLERLKPSVQDTRITSKKIRLSSVLKVQSDCNELTKRKTTEINQDSNSSAKKRQKITWP